MAQSGSGSASQVHALQDMRSWFDNANAFPDLTIICGTRNIKAHRVVLCDRSEWFKRALTGKFLEGGANTIELHDDDSDTVYELLRWCYTLEIPTTLGQEWGPCFLVSIVKMYAAAEKYLVKNLDETLAKRFRQVARDAWWSQSFLVAIEEAYTSTSDLEHRLRDAIADTVVEHADELLVHREKYRDFHEVMDNTPEFAADVARALVMQGQERQQRQMARGALCTSSRWISGHELQFARSFTPFGSPERLQCPICHDLAINAEKLHCCDTSICEDCLPTLRGPDCPICNHAPFDREKATHSKALQTTCKVFLKTEAKKRGIDLKTGEQIVSASRPA